MSFENGGLPTTPQITGPLFNTAPKKSSKTGDSLINDDDTPYVSRSRLCGQVAAPILQTEAPGILSSLSLDPCSQPSSTQLRGHLSGGETEASGLQGHLRKFPGKTICPLPFGATAAHLLHALLPPGGSPIWVTVVPRPLLLVPLCPGVKRSLEGPKNWKSRKPDAQLLG